MCYEHMMKSGECPICDKQDERVFDSSQSAGSVSTIEHYEECFRRIAEAVGVQHPCQLMALCENDEETYADGLVKFIQNKMKPNIAR